MASDNAVQYSAFTIRYHAKLNKLMTPVSVVSGENSVDGEAIWDTGATSSCVSEDVVEKLGLIPIGMREIHTPSGSKSVNTYLVNVILPNRLTVTGVTVLETDIGKQGISMLIGMDIISLGDLAVSNYNQKTAFSFRFPSKETTDYVPQSNIDNLLGKKHGNGSKKRKRK